MCYENAVFYVYMYAYNYADEYYMHIIFFTVIDGKDLIACDANGMYIYMISVCVCRYILLYVCMYVCMYVHELLLYFVCICGIYPCTCVYVTRSGKTGLIRTSTDIHFLPVRESCTHALPRNTKYLIIGGQVYFTDGFLPMLLNHEDAFLGPEGH